MKRSTFTLIELLVVIAIIAILPDASYLPCRRLGRAAGRSCISQLKQIGIAMNFISMITRLHSRSVSE